MKAGTASNHKHLNTLQAAIEEFRGHGFGATSMDRMAANAGLSKRTVHNHFPGKEALFAEILLQLGKRAPRCDLACRSDRTLREQLLELVRQKPGRLDDSNFVDLARVAITETIHAPKRARDMVARLGDKEEGVTVWIRAAMADARLKQLDPVLAARQIQGLVKRFAFWPQITMGVPPLSKTIQEQMACRRWTCSWAITPGPEVHPRCARAGPQHVFLRIDEALSFRKDEHDAN